VKLRVGDKLYLNLLLFTGNNSGNNRVFVELRGQDGTAIKPIFEIPHIGNGVFRESTETMPVDEIVTAGYFVYAQDGTTPDTKFSTAQGIYRRDFVGEISSTDNTSLLDKLNQITALILSHDSNSELIGTISLETTLVGYILGDHLTGYIKEPTNELLGFVEVVETLGTLGNNNTDIQGSL